MTGLRPGQQVYLSYLIPNPSDLNTYYPQAVVKNTQTQAIVATVNLTQDANQPLRYYGSFYAPADSTGNGYYLDSVAIPYTDSAHTTPSMNYGAEMVTFFVVQPSPYFGGGDAVIIDYKQIEEMLDERFSRIPEAKDVVIPDFPDIPVPEKVDLGPVLEGFGPVMQSVKELNERVGALPAPEKVNFAPVLNRIASVVASVEQSLKGHREEIKKMHEEHLAGIKKYDADRLTDLVGQVASQISEKVGSIGETGIPFKLLAADKKEEKKSVPTPVEIMKMLTKK